MPRYKGLVAECVATLLLMGSIGSITALGGTFNSTRPATVSLKQKIVEVKMLRQRVNRHRRTTWRWKDLSLSARTPTIYLEKTTRDTQYLRWLAKLWRKRAAKAKEHANNPPHLVLWMCIHKDEASWTDPRDPYFGGLQMGRWFMKTYAMKIYEALGTADNWEPIQQIWIAERAYAREGYSRRWLFGQWPNTAPPCV